MNIPSRGTVRPTPEYSAEWVADAFGLGRPGKVLHGGRGQKNALGVVRLETPSGCFAIKRFKDKPRPAALAVSGADPDLTAALLSEVCGLDLEKLQRTASLFTTI